MAAAIVLAPDEQQQIAVVDDSVSSVVQAAQAIMVRTAAEADSATAYLSELAAAKRNAEAARVRLVKPLNDHVKMINDEFRPRREALDAADKVVRGKVLTYRAEQDRLRAEQQARLDREEQERQRAAEQERRAAEAKARADREAAAREAARLEAEAVEARRRRERERAANASARRTRIRAMSSDALAHLAFGGGTPDAVMAEEEIAARKRARDAQEAMAAARAAEDAARVAEQAARDAPMPDLPVVAVERAVLSQTKGRVAERKVWQATVVDAAKVPAGYLIVDEKAIRLAVKDGVRSIPGVRIEQVDTLAVRAARL